MRIGGGAAFFNDRLDAALAVVERGEIDAVILDALAERTLAMLHAAHRAGGPGYHIGLPERMGRMLPVCRRHGTVVVSNCGGVDPEATADMIRSVARRADLGGLRIAAVSGDDVTETVRALDPVLSETGQKLSFLEGPVGVANAYLGADAIAQAYADGADVIITGRVTDSALAAGPLRTALGWAADEWNAIASGVLVGHLLECGGQATGGYFAEPGWKEVPGLDDIGFPIAEVGPDLGVTLGKTPGRPGHAPPRCGQCSGLAIPGLMGWWRHASPWRRSRVFP